MVVAMVKERDAGQQSLAALSPPGLPLASIAFLASTRREVSWISNGLGLSLFRYRVIDRVESRAPHHIHGFTYEVWPQPPQIGPASDICAWYQRESAVPASTDPSTVAGKPGLPRPDGGPPAPQRRGARQRGRERPRCAVARCLRPHQEPHGGRTRHRPPPPPAGGRVRGLPAGIALGGCVVRCPLGSVPTGGRRSKPSARFHAWWRTAERKKQWQRTLFAASLTGGKV